MFVWEKRYTSIYRSNCLPVKDITFLISYCAFIHSNSYSINRYLLISCDIIRSATVKWEAPHTPSVVAPEVLFWGVSWCPDVSKKDVVAGFLSLKTRCVLIETRVHKKIQKRAWFSTQRIITRLPFAPRRNHLFMWRRLTRMNASACNKFIFALFRILAATLCKFLLLQIYYDHGMFPTACVLLVFSLFQSLKLESFEVLRFRLSPLIFLRSR